MLEKEIKIKPKIEEIAADYLDGDALNNLLDFVAWLRAGRMTPTFGSKSSEGISYTTRVCYIKIYKDLWYIWPAGKKGAYVNDFLICEELKEIIGASLAACKPCGHNCNSGKGFVKTVCGQDYERICGCCSVRFHNPDAKTLEIIKTVIENRNSIKT